MHHTSYFARHTPERTAAIFLPNGEQLSFGQLEQEANRAAHAMRALGLADGDCIDISITNRPEFLTVMLGAQRIGLHYVLLSTKLSVNDLAYVAEDSGAKVVVISAGCFAAEDVEALASFKVPLLGIDLPEAAMPSWTALTAQQPTSLPDDTAHGREMLYSSGTTGRPKGIRKPLSGQAYDWDDPINRGIANLLGFDSASVFLSPSPLYHAAPHRFANVAMHFGGTAIIPQHFDARTSLEAIGNHHCTHSLWVPTMFHRMLQLPEEVRGAVDLSSHRHAVHGAAPCPMHVKQKMIDWWGPILDEYYSGSEGIGSTMITSTEWLAHPGSVGKPQGAAVHILDADGKELSAGETGDIYFENAVEFLYWGKSKGLDTNASPRGWHSFGDVGYLDADGYLYLTDRRHFTIISGGVNIYPQEIESAFLEHPAVRDVAVIGLPNEEFGQEVLAVIQLNTASEGTDELKDKLRDFIRKRLGPVKTPKGIEFVVDFPRHATGKLYKQDLIALFSPAKTQ